MENALCSIYLKAFSIRSRVTTPAAVTSMYTCLFYFKNRLLSVLWDPMFCGIQISPQDDRQKDKKMFGSNKSISDFYHLLSSTVIKWRRKQSSPPFGFHWNASIVNFPWTHFPLRRLNALWESNTGRLSNRIYMGRCISRTPFLF